MILHLKHEKRAKFRQGPKVRCKSATLLVNKCSKNLKIHWINKEQEKRRERDCAGRRQLMPYRRNRYHTPKFSVLVGARFGECHRNEQFNRKLYKHILARRNGVSFQPKIHPKSSSLPFSNRDHRLTGKRICSSCNRVLASVTLPAPHFLDSDINC